jgi:RNA polymerase sigma-70 factor (ECF subfamily)
LNTTDEQIIARFQASGDTAELGALVDRHLQRVRNLAYRLVLCRATADDIAQDVFVKVMRNAHTFRGEAKFSTWLYRITVNASREHMRKNTTSALLSEYDLPAVINQHGQPEHEAMHSELMETIAGALRGLSDKLRAAIVFTAMEGLSATEAAAIEGCSQATMHWRIHEARKQLKRTLGRQIKL